MDAFRFRRIGDLGAQIQDTCGSVVVIVYLLDVTVMDENHSTGIVNVFESIVLQKNAAEPSRNDHENISNVGNLEGLLRCHRTVHRRRLTSIRWSIRLDAPVSPSSSQSARMALRLTSQILDATR